MATNIFLGYPPENIKQFIIENYGPKEDPMLKVPLHFTAEQDDSSVSLLCYGYDESNDWMGGFINSWCEFQYSMTGKDDDWKTYNTGSVIELNEGETVYFRCPREKDDPLNQNINGLCKYDGEPNHYFEMKGSIKADGNIQFLLTKTGTIDYFPDSCYAYMFSGCKSLTQAPALPATTLSYGCYSNMFEGCSSLTQAPLLPATTLADSCYKYMFNLCTSLPEPKYNMSHMTFDQVADVFKINNIFGGYGDDPIQVQCSDKILIATFDKNKWIWTVTEG